MALLSMQSCRSKRTIVTLKKAAQQGVDSARGHNEYHGRTVSSYDGGAGLSRVQPGGDARLSTSNLGATAVTITRSRHQRGRPGAHSVRENWSTKAVSAQGTFVTLAACGPFCPCTISNSTLSPSCRLL